jgi:hypothetical protein
VPDEVYGIYIWVPGTVQLQELAKFSSPLTSSVRNVEKFGGRDHWFETPQEAFDAADVLRSHRLRYDLQMNSGKPWLRGKREICCG